MQLRPYDIIVVNIVNFLDKVMNIYIKILSIFLICCYAYSNQEPQHKIVNKISFDSPRQINLSKSQIKFKLTNPSAKIEDTIDSNDLPYFWNAQIIQDKDNITISFPQKIIQSGYSALSETSKTTYDDIIIPPGSYSFEIKSADNTSVSDIDLVLDKIPNLESIAEVKLDKFNAPKGASCVGYLKIEARAEMPTPKYSSSIDIIADNSNQPLSEEYINIYNTNSTVKSQIIKLPANYEGIEYTLINSHFYQDQYIYKADQLRNNIIVRCGETTEVKIKYHQEIPSNRRSDARGFR